MRSRSLRVGIALISLLVVSFIGYKASTLAWFALSAAGPGAERNVLVEVKPGHPPLTLARDLESRGLITNARRFHTLGRVLRQWSDVKVGEYEVRPSMSPIEIFSVLTSGVSVQYSVTIPEGHNMYQVADQLDDKGLVARDEFLRLARDRDFIGSLGLDEPVPETVEGYLFPETYFLHRAISAKEIIRTMVNHFQAVWTDERRAKARSMGMNRHEVVTLASMIEKETGVAYERPMISSVFHNRLKKRMRLASDPTTIYGIWDTFDGNLKRRHLREKNDYNTYSFRGLPKGPIANPGREAIDAALQPEKSDFLYFVSRNDGTHEFTRTLKEHEAAVRRFQLNRAAREGKSWRDRLKNN